ncbi:hypothetical protein ACJJTC_015469 [Scirpophaga incertulas]
MLADITIELENQRYFNVQEYFETLKSASVSNENHLHSTTVTQDFTDETHSKSENSYVHLGDQDSTYKPPSKKRRPIPVYANRSKSSERSSSSISSFSSSSGPSSDSSDTDSTDEQNQTQENMVQLTAEKQSEQTNIEITATTEVSVNQEISENTKPQVENKKERKRKRNEESWKQNKTKSLRNAGKSCLSKKNKVTKPRSVQPPCGDKCRLKCCEKITVDQRQTIFDVYWNLGQIDAQRLFIKKDQYDLCLQYKNSTPEQKVLLKESYDAHLEEKTLSRQENRDDRCKIDDKKVIVFDLQAVLQSPTGDTSGFYYKSKLNSYNYDVEQKN